MAAPTIYRSSDTSAPSLSGTAGSLISVLDACLVNGYGSKTAAGWTKPYSGTNKAVYRQAAGNQFYLDVDDSAAGTGGAKEAGIRAYEAMTAVGTGTNPFPTVAQQATPNGRKSATADSTTRGWIVFADDRTFYMFVLTGDSAGSYFSFGFGDIYSLVSGDGYRTALLYRASANSTSAVSGINSGPQTGFNITSSLIHLARTWSGTGTSVESSKVALGSANTNFNMATPNLSDSLIYMSRILAGGSTHLRGWLRGLYQPLNNGNMADGDTFSGTGDFAGRSFQQVGSFHALVETTQWDTSS